MKYLFIFHVFVLLQKSSLVIEVLMYEHTIRLIWFLKMLLKVNAILCTHFSGSTSLKPDMNSSWNMK